jgi:hypothetical protein
MPKREMFTATSLIRNILTAIVARRGKRDERRLVVHVDTARSNTAKVTRAFCDDNFLQIARQTPPPLSPDLAPSGFFFFLFGHLKNRLQGQQFGSVNELLSRVREILDEISVDTLKAFSGSGSTDWTDALQHYSKWKVRGMKQTMVR